MYAVIVGNVCLTGVCWIESLSELNGMKETFYCYTVWLSLLTNKGFIWFIRKIDRHAKLAPFHPARISVTESLTPNPTFMSLYCRYDCDDWHATRQENFWDRDETLLTIGAVWLLVLRHTSYANLSDSLGMIIRRSFIHWMMLNNLHAFSTMSRFRLPIGSDR